MANGFEPFETNEAPGGESPPMGIPLARPIESPDLVILWERPHPFLLPDLSRGAALADIGAIVFLLAVAWLMAELAAGGLVILLVGRPGETPDIDMEKFGQLAFMPSLSFRAFASLVVVAAIVACRGQTSRSVGIGRSGLGINILLGGAAMVLGALVSNNLYLRWRHRRASAPPPSADARH